MMIARHMVNLTVPMALTNQIGCWAVGSSRDPEGKPSHHHVMVMVVVVALGGQGLEEAAIHHSLWVTLWVSKHSCVLTTIVPSWCISSEYQLY